MNHLQIIIKSSVACTGHVSAMSISLLEDQEGFCLGFFVLFCLVFDWRVIH